MRAEAFTATCADGTGTETGYRVSIGIGNLLDVLAPNRVLAEKYREGFRAACCRGDGKRKPDDLYRVDACVKALRHLAAVAFAGVGILGPVARVVFALATPRALDDDGWLFLVKPTLDGMTDAGCWKKDRRVVPYLAGFVEREAPADVLTVNVYLLG